MREGRKVRHENKREKEIESQKEKHKYKKREGETMVKDRRDLNTEWIFYKSIC